jgi:hypothetical protein
VCPLKFSPFHFFGDRCNASSLLFFAARFNALHNKAVGDLFSVADSSHNDQHLHEQALA